MIKRDQFNRFIRKDIIKAFERAAKKSGLPENIFLETVLAEILKVRGYKVKPTGLEKETHKPRKVGFLKAPSHLMVV